MRGYIGYNLVMNTVVFFGIILWGVIVSLLVLLRLDKIIKLLEKK